MYVVFGASGNTGGATARALLESGAAVRAVVRDPAKGEPWRGRGAHVAVADLEDIASLTHVFQGATAAYVLNPPAYTMPDLFVRAEHLAANIAEAARRASLARLVVLSSIGGHLESGTGNIRTNRSFERILSAHNGSIVFLRPAYFMENWAWVAPAAADGGVLPSFLAPTTRKIPMVAAADIGAVAARAMLDDSASGVIELEGPQAYSPDDAASAFAEALGRPVHADALPEAQWAPALAGSGFSPVTIASWIEMFRGFNSGVVDFERRVSTPVRGRVAIEDAVRAIVRRARE